MQTKQQMCKDSTVLDAIWRRGETLIKNWLYIAVMRNSQSADELDAVYGLKLSGRHMIARSIIMRWAGPGHPTNIDEQEAAQQILDIYRRLKAAGKL